MTARDRIADAFVFGTCILSAVVVIVLIALGAIQ